MDEQQIAGKRLLQLAAPYFQRGDRDGLAWRLGVDWSPECLTLLLGCQDAEVVAVASSCLALVADMPTCSSLAPLLHNDTPEVAEAAEDALWSIWFRAGGQMAQAVLARIATGIEGHETENVVQILTELIRSQPDYAEAYHQRSQAHYLENSFSPALRDARHAFKLNPWHFAALANQAHALVAVGNLKEALETYREVLRIHPRMPGIRDAIHHLQRKLAPVGS